MKKNEITNDIIDLDNLKINTIDEVLDFINKKITENKNKKYYFTIKSKNNHESLVSGLRDERINYYYNRDTNEVTIFNDYNKILIGMTENHDYVHRDPGRIKNIVVRYLFGFIKYDIQLDDRIFVILNLIDKNDYEAMFEGPFSEMTMEFENRKFTYYNDEKDHYYYEKISYDKSNCEWFYRFPSFNLKTAIRNIFFDKYYNLSIIHNYEPKWESKSLIFPDNEGSIKRVKENIDFFNKLISKFIGEEKTIYLTDKMKKPKDRKWYTDNGGLEFYPKENLKIINNIKPLRNNKNIINEGEEMDFEKLSSGEKYIIYLLSNMIFYGLFNEIIIDEPELNLHIEWQQLLVEVIKEIKDFYLKKYNFKSTVIISTHSPYIVNSPYVKVGGPEYEEE